MAHQMGEVKPGPLRVGFDRRPKLEFHGSQISSDGGLLPYRELDEVLGLSTLAGEALSQVLCGKNAIKWARLSCRTFRANEVRLQLRPLAYNLANFMRTLALPSSMACWSLTTLREKLVKIGARMVRLGRYITFQLAEVAVSARIFGQKLARIGRLRARLPLPV